MITAPVLSALAAAAAVQGAAVSRRPEFGQVDLASLARNSAPGKHNIERLLGAIHKADFPYREAPLAGLQINGSTSMADMMKDAGIPTDLHRHYFARSIVLPGSARFDIEIEPNVEKEIISGHGPSQFAVSSTTAKIDFSKEGWTRENAKEAGGSVSVNAGFSWGLFSGGASGTVTGNMKWSNGENGEKSKQTSFQENENLRQDCPPRHLCSVQTWTYRTALTANWATIPLVERGQIPNNFITNATQESGNNSLAVFNPAFAEFRALGKMLEHFFQLDETTGNKSVERDLPDCALPNGGAYEGILMHPKGIVSNYKTQNESTCSWYQRKANGEPFRTVVVLSEPLDKQPDNSTKSNGQPTNGKDPGPISMGEPDSAEPAAPQIGGLTARQAANETRPDAEPPSSEAVKRSFPVVNIDGREITVAVLKDELSDLFAALSSK